MKNYNIYIYNQDKTIGFAAEELSKYLKATEEMLNIGVQRVDGPYNNGIGLHIGLFREFDITSNRKTSYNSADDEIFVDVNNATGIIAGVNPRSVLLAVYRFLYQCGLRWIRPGIDGEVIPHSSVEDKNVTLHEMPSHRHRCIAIEGSVSYENLEAMIDWIPKVGFNGYFIQFKEAYIFFDRWYSHKLNPNKKPETFNLNMAAEFTRLAENELEKRGLLYHAVGHAWTCEPLGIKGLGWAPEQHILTDDKKMYLALINGKREIFKNIALNTNLCYSNPEAVNLMINQVINHLRHNPHIDILHFWLADGVNNQCECSECIKKRPSDWYVDICNRLDEELTINEINTKIVFLAYVDLLWEPKTSRINNPDRFIFMFAPIHRTFRDSFSDAHEPIPLPDYQRNKLTFPVSVEENLGALHEWKEVFSEESFLFDYALSRVQFGDPGQLNIANVIGRDVKALKKVLKMDGYISCQVQRIFFPTGFPIYLMGRTLWDDTLDFEFLIEDYFTHAFGNGFRTAVDYLNDISKHFDMPYWYGERPWKDDKLAGKFAEVSKIVSKYSELIELYADKANGIQKISWEYLKLHMRYCTLFADVLLAKATGDEEKTKIEWQKLTQYVWDIEDEVQPVFDCFRFVDMGRRIFD